MAPYGGWRRGEGGAEPSCDGHGDVVLVLVLVLVLGLGGWALPVD